MITLESPDDLHMEYCAYCHEPMNGYESFFAEAYGDICDSCYEDHFTTIDYGWSEGDIVLTEDTCYVQLPNDKKQFGGYAGCWVTMLIDDSDIAYFEGEHRHIGTLIQDVNGDYHDPDDGDYFICVAEDCGAIWPADDAVEIDDDPYCPSCAEQVARQCDECATWIRHDRLQTFTNGAARELCPACYEIALEAVQPRLIPDSMLEGA